MSEIIRPEELEGFTDAADWVDNCGRIAETIKTLTAERDALKAENEWLKKQSVIVHEVSQGDALKDRDRWRTLAMKAREALEHCKNRPHEHNPSTAFTLTHCEVIDEALASFPTEDDKGLIGKGAPL